MSDPFPAFASSLLINGKIFSQTSMFGEGVPNHHPSVDSFLHTQLAARPQRFAGNCAELALISDQLWGLDTTRTDQDCTSLEEALRHFRGAILVSKKIRPHGNPEHGQLTEPCWICQNLLDALGVQVISE
ncbi:YwqJ-related putative deaminase [Nocardia sp. NBC_01388]|uniref:YwqJ-related putative deaminase n=1 Tax=Nocardia sp. NBC_01388 TaxID=2903596 RepID=UPI00324C9781